MTKKYYMPEPKSPRRDPVAWLLWGTLGMLTCGLILGGIFSYGLADVSIIPARTQSIISLIASALVMIGVEGNTLPTGVIVFEKWGDSRMHWLDRAAIIASFIGSVMAATIFLSQRQVLFSDSWWRSMALREGPLLAAFAIIVDYYGGIASLGRMRRDYKENMEQWLREVAEWNETHGIAEPVDRSGWRAATIDDARRLAASLNGERPHVNAANLQNYMDALQVRVDVSDTTRTRWAEMVRSGGS